MDGGCLNVKVMTTCVATDAKEADGARGIDLHMLAVSGPVQRKGKSDWQSQVGWGQRRLFFLGDSRWPYTVFIFHMQFVLKKIK